MNMHPQHSAPKCSTNRKMTVLIIDDVPENLRLLGDCLKADHNIRVANTGLKGLEAARIEPRPDLILLDIMMPGLDGYKVLQRLQEHSETADIPVIFITAMSDSEDVCYGLELGAVDYITKPFSAPIVKARVKNHLELKASRDLLAQKNNWLEEEVALRVNENEIIRDLTVRTLACLAEERDNETGLHIIRTQNYVELLANQLQASGHYQEELSNGRAQSIVRAAPLHDIGKVGIPDAILLKPGKLTVEEFEVMKKHPRIGANAIDRAIELVVSAASEEAAIAAFDALDFLSTARDIALGHHEKWDGTGYPLGIAGTDIPLCARLMALSDVFDALTTPRVYKPAFSFEEAEHIIEEGSGKHFDPVIVDAFIACRAQFKDTACRLADEQTPPEFSLAEGIDQ